MVVDVPNMETVLEVAGRLPKLDAEVDSVVVATTKSDVVAEETEEFVDVVPVDPKIEVVTAATAVPKILVLVVEDVELKTREVGADDANIGVPPKVDWEETTGVFNEPNTEVPPNIEAEVVEDEVVRVPELINEETPVQEGMLDLWDTFTSTLQGLVSEALWDCEPTGSWFVEITDVETGTENKFAEMEFVLLGLDWIETTGETNDVPVGTEELVAPKVKFAPMVLLADIGVIVSELLTSLNRFALESGKFNCSADVVTGLTGDKLEAVLETAEFIVVEAIPKAVVDFTLDVLWTAETVVAIDSLNFFSPDWELITKFFWLPDSKSGFEAIGFGWENTDFVDDGGWLPVKLNEKELAGWAELVANPPEFKDPEKIDLELVSVVFILDEMFDGET